MKLNIHIFRRKQREEAYKGKYHKPEGTAHKAVYISRENHEAVRRIVGMAGENGTTISGYIDRIVTEHLEHHGTEPESLHRKKSHDVVGQIAVSLW